MDVCFGMAQAESPRLDRAALERLKALIRAASGAGCPSMVQARPYSLSLEEEADATPGPPLSCPQTRVVSARDAESGMAPPAAPSAVRRSRILACSDFTSTAGCAVAWPPPGPKTSAAPLSSCAFHDVI